MGLAGPRLCAHLEHLGGHRPHRHLGRAQRAVVRCRPPDQPAQHAARDARPGVQHRLRSARRLLPRWAWAWPAWPISSTSGLMFAVSSGVLIVVSLVGALLPGIGQPAAEWRRSLRCCAARRRRRPSASGARPRSTTCEALGRYIPALAGMPQRDRDALIRTGRVLEAEAGTVVTRAGETGDSAYFVLAGGWWPGRTSGEGEYQSLSAMGPGDVIGEIARADRQPAHRRRGGARSRELLQVPAETLQAAHGAAAVRPAGARQDAGAPGALDQHRRPAALRSARPAGAARAARRSPAPASGGVLARAAPA